MRSRVIVKCRQIFGYYLERVMEWLHSISFRIVNRKTGERSLVEEYVIYEQYAGEEFVKDFLYERTLNSTTNRYCIRIKTAPDEENKGGSNGRTEVIGKARLLRKETLIDEARLIIKSREKKLIYWEFDN